MSEEGDTSMKGLKMCPLLSVILSVFALVILSCNGGSGSGNSSGSGTTGGATVSGIVADGYVSNANVYIYSNADTTTQIGSGATDSNGNFSITLSVSAVPDLIYIKSVGGTDVATGMPAPTMLFVGSGSSGTFNITPLTDCLYKYSLTMGFDEAKQHLTGQLLISEAELFDDPVANTDLTGALNSVLSSGTMDGTLTDGDYIVYGMLFLGSPLGPPIVTQEPVEMNVTISNGVVSGTEVVDIDGNLYYLTGRVQGSSVVLTLADDPNPGSVSELLRIAGDIGLMGSVTGVVTYFDTAPVFATGMFVANFLPATAPVGIGSEVAGVISSIYSGPRHMVLRDIFGGTNMLGWGDLNINIDPDTGDFTAGGPTTLYFDNDSCEACDPTQVPVEFVSGEIFETSGGDRTNIIYLEFEIAPPSGEMLYLLQPVGSRRGFFVVDAATFMIGDAYMSTGAGLAPSLDSTTNYEVKVAVAHAGMLDQLRSDWIGTEANMMPYSDSFTTPDISGGTDFDLTGDLLKVFNGSLIAFKNDADGGFSDATDFIRLVELYETGAIQGEEILGGLLPSGDPLGFYPATFVGFVKKQGETAPSVAGTRNFLARALYGLDPTGYLNVLVTGDLTISGLSATLNWTESGGTSGTASLTVENTDGLYHMHGVLNSTTYIDIFWPLGGKKSVYITSDNETGGWVITEVGEAYLTH